MEPIKDPIGLGDALKEIIHSTGTDKVHAAVVGAPTEELCSPCEARRRAANKLVPDVRPKAVFNQVKDAAVRVYKTYVPKNKK